MKTNLLYSKTICLNVDLIQNTLRKTSRIMFDHISGYHILARLTHKVNHHTLTYQTPAILTFYQYLSSDSL